jgi:hypothetical protein
LLQVLRTRPEVGARNVVDAEPRTASMSMTCHFTAILGLVVDPIPPW